MMITEERWGEANAWEAAWWGECLDTLNEEMKQIVYAEKMGLVATKTDQSPFVYDMKGGSVVDIGGGPVSLLLKCKNVKGVVIDPMPLPIWVQLRYHCANIAIWPIKVEQLGNVGRIYDEVWIYNTLQHVHDPTLVVTQALQMGRLIRVFEWIDTETNVGHPHSFTKEALNKLFSFNGTTSILNGLYNCHGKCWSGVIHV